MTTEQISPAMIEFHRTMAAALAARTAATTPLCEEYARTIEAARRAREAAGDTPAARRAFARARNDAARRFDLMSAEPERVYNATLAAAQAAAAAPVVTQGELVSTLQSLLGLLAREGYATDIPAIRDARATLARAVPATQAAL